MLESKSIESMWRKNWNSISK